MDQKRILYADNDRSYLDGRCELLEYEGFEIIKAYSLDEAEQILERENIHLAILDIRLVDDDDTGDISGILLAKDDRYKRIPKIIVTGYPTFEAVRDAVGSNIGDKPVAHAFLAKDEGLVPLVKAMNSAFDKVVGINWNLRIIWDEMALPGSSSLALLIENGLAPALLEVRGSELLDVLRKLFARDEQISMIHLNWARDGCVCLTLFASNEGASRQAVVILGEWKTVNEQRLRAEKYLTIESDLLPQPSFAETLRYAGLVYAFPDDGSGPLQTAAAYFNEAADRNVRIAIENIYKQVLLSWHSHDRSEIDNTDLAAVFCDRLGIPSHAESLKENRKKIQALARNARSHSLVKELSFEGSEVVLILKNGEVFRGPDPLATLIDPLSFSGQKIVSGLTFGGIHSASLLIDGEGRVYPTDMMSTTHSPILEDFVSIESELHFDLFSPVNLLSSLDFEKQLGESKTLNDMLPVGNVEPECRRAMSAIQTIRKLASEAAGDALKPYLIGLFHYILKPLITYDPQILLAKHQMVRLIHRLMAASIIITQILDLIDGDEQPVANPEQNQGLKIVEASREVTVNGREVQLTQTEFKLLLYLYNNPNRLCSRDEILAKVRDIKGSPTKADMQLLNTHIDRLRKKIDTNTAKHTYIVTIRGEGYLLDMKS